MHGCVLRCLFVFGNFSLVYIEAVEECGEMTAAVTRGSKEQWLLSRWEMQRAGMALGGQQATAKHFSLSMLCWQPLA
ncbi:hypothetical protein HDV62DRAFT_348472 [Trichoderma sp. SZMC 28011]